MKQLILCLITLFFLSAQESTIFTEVEKKPDAIKAEHPEWVLSFGGGYLFHEGNDFMEFANDFTTTDYSNGAHFYLDINRYFFQGIYLVLATTVSTTEEIITPSAASQATEVQKRKFLYVSPYLGLNYFIRTNRDFTTPWFISFGLGENIFSGSEANFSRFSVMFKAGKIIDVEVLSGRLTFDISTLIHEDRGLRQYYFRSGGYTIPAAFPDFVTFVTFKMSVGLSFDVMSL